MVVVIGIITVVLPTLYAIFFIVLRQQIKVIRLSEVQREGTFVVNMIESTIKKNALTIHSAVPPQDSNKVCAFAKNPASGDLYFKDKTASYFRFYQNGQTIVYYESNTPSTNIITSTNMVASNFSASCTITGYSSPIVTMKFTLTSSDSQATLNFQSTVTLPMY